MVQFRPHAREVIAKIVYYGPPLGGKTSNLHTLYEGYPKDIRGELAVVPAGADRTIYFDFLPLDAGTLRTLRLRVQLYTVPGQVEYNSTRQLVLRGVDGVVFVADSRRSALAANLESWLNLKENLTMQGLALADTPHVVQYNKRDLDDILPVENLDEFLNEFNAPFYEAVATTGIGVQETLQAAVKLVVRSLRDRFQLASEGAPATPVAPPEPPPAADGGARVYSFGATPPEPPGQRQEPRPYPQPSPLTDSQAGVTRPVSVATPEASAVGPPPVFTGPDPGSQDHNVPSAPAAPPCDPFSSADLPTVVRDSVFGDEPPVETLGPPEEPEETLVSGPPGDVLGAGAPGEEEETGEPLRAIVREELGSRQAPSQAPDALAVSPSAPPVMSPLGTVPPASPPPRGTHAAMDELSRLATSGRIPLREPAAPVAGPPSEPPRDPFEITLPTRDLDGFPELPPAIAETVAGGGFETVELPAQPPAGAGPGLGDVPLVLGGDREGEQGPAPQQREEWHSRPFGGAPGPVPGSQGVRDDAAAVAPEPPADEQEVFGAAQEPGEPPPAEEPGVFFEEAAPSFLRPPMPEGFLPVPEADHGEPDAGLPPVPSADETVSRGPERQQSFVTHDPPAPAGFDEYLLWTSPEAEAELPAPEEPLEVAAVSETSKPAAPPPDAAGTPEILTIPPDAIARVAPRVLAQYGDVRELEIEVPVPALWTGGKRITLQLRMTLVPEETGHDESDHHS